MTDPNTRKIGTVHSINGTTADVYTSDGMVGITGPVELIGGELKKFCGYIARAWFDVQEWERANAGEDGGDPGTVVPAGQREGEKR